MEHEDTIRGVYSNRSCCVKNCSNHGRKLKKLLEEMCIVHATKRICCSCPWPFTLLPFPSKRTDENHPELMKSWTRCINRLQEKGSKKDQPWLPNKDSRICSEHFVKGHPYPIINMGHTNIPDNCKLPSRKPPRKCARNEPDIVPDQQNDIAEFVTTTVTDTTPVTSKTSALQDHDYEFQWEEDKGCEDCFWRIS